MVPLILKFVGSARGAGLRISTTEVLDCLQQLELVDMLDESEFSAVLRANFAKSRREQANFDRLYHLFFHEFREQFNSTRDEPLAKEIQDIVDQLPGEMGEDSTLAAVLELLAGDPAAYLAEMRSIQSEGEGEGRGLGSNLGAVTRRLRVLLLLREVGERIGGFLEKSRGQLPWEKRRDLAVYFDDRLETARRLLTREDRPYNDSLQQRTSYEKHLQKLGETAFAALSPKEVMEMREVIEQLVRKLKDTIGRRYAVKNRGVLDVKKTLRRSSRYYGVPIEIVYRNRPLRKGKIVTLCDVSGSVWSAARFMLNMLYSLQDCFTQVRSFIFVAGLDEVTEIFQENEINEAIEKVLSEAELDYNAATDYGLTFRQFRKSHMDTLNKKTTIIIIGDGRSNYSNPEAEILGEMREKSRRVIWLNPETPQFWYSGDSEMRTYQAYCHEVRLCQNLNQLMDFIRDLVL